VFILKVRYIINTTVCETVHVAVISREFVLYGGNVFAVSCTGEFLYFDFVTNKSTASG
jgi:hypothetical protein